FSQEQDCVVVLKPADVLDRLAVRGGGHRNQDNGLGGAEQFVGAIKQQRVLGRVIAKIATLQRYQDLATIRREGGKVLRECRTIVTACSGPGDQAHGDGVPFRQRTSGPLCVIASL